MVYQILTRVSPDMACQIQSIVFRCALICYDVVFPYVLVICWTYPLINVLSQGGL